TNPITGTITGNAGTATALQTARNINGISFNGTTDITLLVNANSLTGTTLAPNVLNSSLTSVGTLTNLAVTNPITGTITGNAGTATALQTARNINGVSFNGTTDITLLVNANSLTGTTLASNVTASSLTSVGTLTNLAVTNPITGTITGNAATATALQNARTINGVSFNGTTNITVPADASTLTGTSLPATITGSSLTSVGTLGSLAVSGTASAGTISATTGAMSNLNVTGSITAGTFSGVVMYIDTAAMVAGTQQGFFSSTGYARYGHVVKYNDTLGLFANRLKLSDTAIMLGGSTYYGVAAPANTGYARAGNVIFYKDTAGIPLWINALRKSDTSNMLVGNQVTTGYAKVGTVVKKSSLTNNTITDLSISSLIQTNNLTATGTVQATNFIGTLSTGAQPNITSVGTLNALAVSGTITGGTFSGTLANGIVGIANLSATGTPNATTYLRGDNTWATVAGTGTVTSVSVATANGVSGSVTNPTTTPDITLTLGAITPTSVTSSGTVAGSTLSGTVSTAAQPNITSVGTLTGLTVTAPINGSVTGSAATVTSASQPNITTLSSLVSIGTITTGVWNGTAIAAANGGTGQTSYTIGDILFASGATALSKLADVATGNALISGGVGTAPSWGKIDLTTHVSGTLPVANGGTGLTTGTSGGILGFTAAGTLASSAALTSNALVIGGGAGVTPSTLAIGAADQVLAVNSAGTGYTHKLIRTMLPPTWGRTNLAASVTNSQLIFSIAGVAQIAAGSRIAMPNAGIITGVMVSGSAARTAGTATFTVFNNGVATAVTGVIDVTNSQFVASTGGTATFVAGDILDLRVTTTATWAPTTAEWGAMIVVAFTD
ncbi:MAG: hypothetical protein Q8R50_03970, partial [Sediminibacterium sp.]|nr:hypothetical protein [Sediminibacterium sp.]